MTSSILNIWFVLYAFFIGMLVYGLRRAAESQYPSLRSASWWNNLVLYFLPILLGGGLAVLMRHLGSEIVSAAIKSDVDTAIWGSIAGGLSGFVYTIGRKSLKQRAASILKDSSGGDAS